MRFMHGWGGGAEVDGGDLIADWGLRTSDFGLGIADLGFGIGSHWECSGCFAGFCCGGFGAIWFGGLGFSRLGFIQVCEGGEVWPGVVGGELVELGELVLQLGEFELVHVDAVGEAEEASGGGAAVEGGVVGFDGDFFGRLAGVMRDGAL